MTHTDSIALWGLILAVLALVLHIPLSMLAHHYLPRIEDYLASNSRERLIKRIAKLQRRLDELNDPKYFEKLEWVLREHLFVTVYLFGGGFFALAAALLMPGTGTSMFWHQLYSVFALVSFTMGTLVAGRNMSKSGDLRPSRRSQFKLQTQAQLDGLKAKLDAFDAKFNKVKA